MTSPASLAANAANAQLSTGPKPPEGKLASSQNASKHGLSSPHAVVTDETRPFFEELHQSFHSELLPATSIETTLVDKIVISRWNMQRIEIMEVEYHDEHPEAHHSLDGHENLDRLRRYYVTAERSFYRALTELRAIQTARISHATHTTKLPLLVKTTGGVNRGLAISDMDLLFPDPRTARPIGGEAILADIPKRPVQNEPNSPAPIARNGPCPCGSDHKYKHCCGRNT